MLVGHLFVPRVSQKRAGEKGVCTVKVEEETNQLNTGFASTGKKKKS